VLLLESSRFLCAQHIGGRGFFIVIDLVATDTSAMRRCFDVQCQCQSDIILINFLSSFLSYVPPFSPWFSTHREHWFLLPPFVAPFWGSVLIGSLKKGGGEGRRVGFSIESLMAERI
jgi:hypothetical protein